jgi:hypothetical protein
MGKYKKKPQFINTYIISFILLFYRFYFTFLSSFTLTKEIFFLFYSILFYISITNFKQTMLSKHKINLITLFLFLQYFSFGQNTKSKYLSNGYYEKVYKADSCFIQNNYVEAFNILDKLFTDFSPVNLPIYEEYKTYVKLCHHMGHKDKYKIGLTTLVRSYGISWNQIEYDDILSKISRSMSFSKVEYETLHYEFNKRVNNELRTKILQMKERDQRYRRSRDDFDMHLSLQDSIDESNTIQLIEIFEKYGFPTASLVGVNNFEKRENLNIRALLLHTKDSIRLNYFLPKIKEFIEEGTCNPIIYGVLIDQMLIYQNKEQIYGTFSNRVIKISLEKVNQNRKAIGLPNYGYEVWRRKQLYPQFQTSNSISNQ